MADTSRQTSIRLNAVDGLGRRIDPAVLAAAEEIAPRAFHWGERLLRDPALAASLLEEAAATVSRAIRLSRNTGAGVVGNLHGYVFRSFLRRANKVRLKDPLLANPTRVNPAVHNPVDVAEELELKILMDEFLARCDPVIQDMFFRRMQGFSWKEIGCVHGISAHAAESRFSQALRRVRKKVGLK